MEVIQKLAVGRQTTEKRSIEAVHGLTGEAQQGTQKEKEQPRMQEAWLLLQKSLMECLGAFYDPDLVDLMTLQDQNVRSQSGEQVQCYSPHVAQPARLE